MRKILFLLIPLLLCSCSHDMNRQEIDEINLVLVLGIDYSDGEYTLSALYSTGGGADPEEGAGGGKEDIAKGTGQTAYEALEDLKLKDKKTISLAQAGAFLIGNEAASQGLDQCLDFLSRDETIKMEALIYIIKDRNASDFMEQGMESGQTIHEDFEAIEQKQLEYITRNDNTVVNLLNDMKQTYSSILVPYLIAEETGYLIEGYAVFDEMKLRDYLDQETSNGVNFIRNIIRTFPIYLDDQAGLLVSYTETKLESKVDDNRITIKIKVDFETAVKEIITKENIFNYDKLLQLTQAQNDYLKGILEKPVNYSIATGQDIFNAARLVENQNVTVWRELEGNWSELISEIDYEYELNSKITKSFILGDER